VTNKEGGAEYSVVYHYPNGSGIRFWGLVSNTEIWPLLEPIMDEARDIRITIESRLGDGKWTPIVNVERPAA